MLCIQNIVRGHVPKVLISHIHNKSYAPWLCFKCFEFCRSWTKLQIVQEQLDKLKEELKSLQEKEANRWVLGLQLWNAQSQWFTLWLCHVQNMVLPWLCQIVHLMFFFFSVFTLHVIFWQESGCCKGPQHVVQTLDFMCEHCWLCHGIDAIFSFATSSQASAQEELAKLKNELDSSKNAEVCVDLGEVMTDK